MSRITDILTNCRDSLSDTKSSRWSDSRLLRLISEAQTKIATKAQLLRRNTTISILANQVEYTLPSDAFLLTRVVDENGDDIAIKSHAELDDDNPLGWEIDEGTNVQAIIFDNQEPNTFKTYPIVTEVAAGETFVVPDYGIAAEVEGDIMTGDFGAVVDITTPGSETTQFDSVYGAVVYMAEVTEILKIYYRARPRKVAEITDVLEIDEKWDHAIQHYVVGRALQDDQDTKNSASAKEELEFFKSEFNEAHKVSSKDHTSRSHNKTRYNPGI